MRKKISYQLQQSGDCLQLVDPEDSSFKPLVIDFVGGSQGHRRQFGGGELIVRAVGAHKQKGLRVLDCTAGLGRDGFVLANCGCKVTMLERSVVLYQLLEDAMRRYAESDLPELGWELLNVDALSFMQNGRDAFDVVYLDPMYPERKKSALVKKELRIIRDVVGDDDDSEELFFAAKKIANKKVVVKRPKLAECIAGEKPNYQVSGKSGRFDVYIIGNEPRTVCV